MKLVQESLDEFKKFMDGKRKNLNASDVDQKQLSIGIAVEKEHSSDIEIRKMIALDHLAEDPMYYSKLVKSGIVDEKEALDLYNKYYK